MATSTQLDFLKALACMAWADGEFTHSELSFIKNFARQFELNGDDWLQLEMYVGEKVHAEEAKRALRRFLSRIRKPAERRKLVQAVEQLLKGDGELADAEREWLEDLEQAIAETSGGSFLLDGLRSFIRLGGQSVESSAGGREAELHDFIHNRVLFKLRRRLGSKRLEREGKPEKLKKITLSAALLVQVGYVDEEFLPQEEKFIQSVLCKVWGLSSPTAEAITKIAAETMTRSVDQYRLINEAKATMSTAERKVLVEGLFTLANVEGKMSVEEIEEIRDIAHAFGFSHKEFINAKLKVLGKY